jgi:hypothetical protein
MTTHGEPCEPFFDLRAPMILIFAQAFIFSAWMKRSGN